MTVVEKKVHFVINLILSIAFITFGIFYLTIECNAVLFLCMILLLLICIYVTIKELKYESYFTINKHGFSYGKRERFRKKRNVKETVYSWSQIKNMYFKTRTVTFTTLYLIVLKKNVEKNTIGMSLLPLSKRNFKQLVIEYSERDDIFRN